MLEPVDTVVAYVCALLLLLMGLHFYFEFGY